MVGGRIRDERKGTDRWGEKRAGKTAEIVEERGTVKKERQLGESQ